MSPQPRYTASSINDALDELYARLEAAEAAVIRAHNWADELDAVARRAHTEAAHPVAAGLRIRLGYDPRKESTAS